MICTRPVKGYRAIHPNASGKFSTVFDVSKGIINSEREHPCGQCMGCRLNRSRENAVKCVHEATLYDRNCFITLTYAPEFLPSGKSLHYPDFQHFMYRLRKRFGPGIRFYMCGEYGEKNDRPHYHAILFNFDFKDRRYLETSKLGHRLDTSEALSELWSDPKTKRSLGLTSVGNASFQSAAYVARYITKKLNGEKGFYHYNTVDYSTGEILLERKPEFTHSSNRPGIGAGWLERFMSDIYPSDEVAIKRDDKIIFSKPPRYYDKLLERKNPELYALVKLERVNLAKEKKLKHDQNLYNRPLWSESMARETITLAKAKLFLKRSYENDS